MISTALALQDATKDAVHDPYIMGKARELFDNRDMDEETFIRGLFDYSAHLSALTATLVVHAVLTKSQLDEMMDTINEMETMGKDIINE